MSASNGANLGTGITMEQLMREHGPYFGGSPVCNEELYAKLEGFGRAFWRLPSFPQRETARQQWVQFLVSLNPVLGVPDPWRIVQAAITGGRTGPTAPSARRWLSDVELLALPASIDLVQGLVPEAAFFVPYGAPGSGKTFFVLDLALCVAANRSFHGHDVRQGPVAYVVAEGVRGIGRRVAAWRSARQHPDPIPVHFLPQAVRVLQPSDVEALLGELGAWNPAPALVVFDTVAQCLVGGDENTPKDMGTLIDVGNQIRQRFGAAFLAVHHSGWDLKRERGSSTLRGAADLIAKVSNEDGIVSVTCDKNKDGPPFLPLRFRLEPKGDSCILTHAAERPEDFTGNDRKALAALRTIVLDDGVTATHWEKCAGLAHNSFYTTRKRLVEGGYVVKRGKQYYPADATEVPSTDAVPF